MKSLSASFRTALAFTLSWTIATGPLAMIPQVAVAQESDFSKAFNLVEDLNTLLERAAYPNVPRRGPQGPPSISEMAEAQSRLLSLKASLQQTYLARVLQAGTDDAQVSILKEIEKYFEAVSRFEGLKIMLGQSSDPESWDALYNFKFPLKTLSQGKFLEVASTYAQNAVLLPVEGYDREEIQKQINEGSFFFTHIEENAGNWNLTFRLNPKFAADAERLYFLTRPSLKSGLQYAAHFSMQRLYDSLVITRIMRRESPASLPAPPKAAQDRYLSMKVARFQAVRGFQTAMDKLIKPEVYKTLLDTVEKSGVHALTNEFFAHMAAIKSVAPRVLSDAELATIHKEEIVKFARSLSTLLNLSEITDWRNMAKFYLKESKRLAMRSALIGDETARGNFTESDIWTLEGLIDIASEKFADDVLVKSPGLSAEIKKISAVGEKEFMTTLRIDFQKKLQQSSEMLRDYRKQEIVPAYIYGAQAAYIQDLNPSEATQTLVKKVSESPSYAQAYQEYKVGLATLLREFLVNDKPVQDVGIEELTRLVPTMKWNPSALKGKIPDRYIPTFNTQPAKGWLEQLTNLTPQAVQSRLRPITGFTPTTRQKELMDVLAMGRLLKFNVYEGLNGKPATVENLKLDDTLLGPITRTENRAYLEEMKKSLLNNSPLLGGTPKAISPREHLNNQMVWEYLADSKVSDERKVDIVEKQLAVVEARIHENEQAVAAQLAKVDAISGEDISGLSNDMRVLASRAYQISSGLEQFASFNDFYQKMRNELRSPGLVRVEWERFSTFANNSMTYMLIFMIGSLFGTRAGPVGKTGDAVGRLLTPLCGPNFKCVTPIFYTLIGVSLSDQLYRGFISEAQNLEVLKRYFECGSDAPCVAVYTDIKEQTDVMMMPRYQALTTVVQLAVIIGFFVGARKIINYFATPRFSSIDLLKRDLTTLGLSETAPLSRESLQVAVRDSLAKARAQTDMMTRAHAESLVTQSYARLESTLRLEAGKWIGFEQRYSDVFAKMGLNKTNWLDADTLVRALNQVEFRYKNGQLLRSDYQEQMGALMSAYQKLRPVWNEMEKSALMNNYYRRAWSLAGNSTDVSIQSSIAGYNSQISRRFMNAMNDFYGTKANARLDEVLENIAAEIKNSPGLRAKRVEQLKLILEKGAN